MLSRPNIWNATNSWVSPGPLMALPPGRWNGGEGASRCTDCPLGRASDLLGATLEDVCEAGILAVLMEFVVAQSVC